jgi:hypothetical protein
VRPGTGFPGLGVPGPFDRDWAEARDNAALQIENAAANIIDFQKKKRERDEAKEKDRLKNCPPDDGQCKRDQEQLESRGIILLQLAPSELLPVWQLRNQIVNFNLDVAEHNKRCPGYEVAPLPTPGPYPSEYLD